MGKEGSVLGDGHLEWAHFEDGGAISHRAGSAYSELLSRRWWILRYKGEARTLLRFCGFFVLIGPKV